MTNCYGEAVRGSRNHVFGELVRVRRVATRPNEVASLMSHVSLTGTNSRGSAEPTGPPGLAVAKSTKVGLSIRRKRRVSFIGEYLTGRVLAGSLVRRSQLGVPRVCVCVCISMLGVPRGPA